MKKRGRPPKNDPALRPAWAIRFAAFRAELGLSQAEMAEKCGIAQSTLADYERGETAPTLDFIVRISKIFKRNMADIIIGKPTGQKFPSPEELNEQEKHLGPMQEDSSQFDDAFVRLCVGMQQHLALTVGYQPDFRRLIVTVREMWRIILRMGEAIPIDVRVDMILGSMKALRTFEMEQDKKSAEPPKSD